MDTKVGTGLFLNINNMIEQLYSLLVSRAAGNKSNEARHAALSLLDSLLKKKILNKNY